MACLTRHVEPDLRTLADEMDLEIESGDKVGKIMKKIEESPGFDEEWARVRLEVIVETRREAEKREERKAALEAEERKAALKAEERKAALEAEERREERRAEREFELDKIRLTQAVETVSVSSVQTDEIRASKSAKLIMQKYDPDKSDIALFLTLFERQVKKTNINPEYWVMHLLSLLPIEIAEIVMREPEEEAEDFDHVKKLLLDRYKISPEAFRTKFVQCQRRPGSLWRDMIFELSSYLTGWLEGMKVSDFESLKRLMIADQIKRRVPAEIKDHFLTEWGNISEPDELVKKLDEYEAARKSIRKPVPSIPTERRTQEKGSQLGKPGLEKKREAFRNEPPNWRKPANNDSNWRRNEMERRKVPACFNCGSTEHLRPQCPKLKRETEMVNNIAHNGMLSPYFEPYLSKAKVNETEITVLRDSGSNCDLVPEKCIEPENLTGEVIWLKQPLDDHSKCLPLAQVCFDSETFGKIETIAAVVDKSLKMNHYLLGNRTYDLIQEKKGRIEAFKALAKRREEKRKALMSGEPIAEKAPFPSIEVERPQVIQPLILSPVGSEFKNEQSQVQKDVGRADAFEERSADKGLVNLEIERECKDRGCEIPQRRPPVGETLEPVECKAKQTEVVKSDGRGRE